MCHSHRKTSDKLKQRILTGSATEATRATRVWAHHADVRTQFAGFVQSELVAKLALPTATAAGAAALDDEDIQRHPLIVRLAALAEVAASVPAILERASEAVLRFVIDELLPSQPTVRARPAGREASLGPKS